MNSFLRFLTTCAVFSATTISAYSAAPLAIYEVGKQPSFVIHDVKNNCNHVFCMGYDKDFDGTFDKADGDEISTWWKIPTSHTSKTVATKFKDFAMAEIPFQVRPFFDFANDAVYIHNAKGVSSYKISDGSLIEKDIIKGKVSSVYVRDGHLFYCKPVFNKKGTLNIYSLKDKKSLGTLPGGVNLQEAAPYFTSAKKQGVAILNVDKFGSADGNITLVEIDHQNPANNKTKVVTVGKTPNSMVIDGDNLYVVMNADHNVKVIDLVKQEVSNTIKVGTDGMNGPRAAVINDGKIYVTTYAGDYRVIDIKTGKEDKKVMTGGKAEALAFGKSNKNLIVTNINVTGSYDPFNKVSVYPIDPSSVNDNNTLATSDIYPNPVVSNATVTLKNTNIVQTTDVRVCDVNGQVVVNFSTDIANNSTFQFDVSALNLTSGTYFLSINSGRTTIPFVVAK